LLKIKLYLLVLILPVLAIKVQAQKPPVFFQQINTANGLSHNRVNCILQDKRGFIWIGTNDGLNRYDGEHFEIFRHRPSDTTSISGNIITDILEDANEVLWIATTDGGITKYNYRLPPAQQFKQYKHSDANPASIPVNVVNSLLLHKNKYLWIGTSGAGTLRFDMEKEKFEYASSKGNTTFLDLCFDNNGKIWGGKQGGGYVIINPETLQQTIDERYIDLYAKLPHMAINTMLADGNDMWAGSWDKVLYKINSTNKAEVIYKPEKKDGSFTEDEILSFAKDKTGNIWIGGKNKGLQYFDKSKNTFYNYNYDAAKAGTIANNRINCLFIDNTGTLWAGTDRGISRSNPMLNQFEQIFLHADNKTPATIYDFYRDENEVLWIGTNQGLYQQLVDGSITKIPLKYNGENLQVSKFFKDKETGTLYIGTNYSLFIFTPITNTITLLPNTDKDVVMKKIIDSRVVSITKDTINNHPVIVVLPYGHYLAWYDLIEQKWYSRTDSIKKIVTAFGFKDHLIRKVFKAGDGGWYMATGKQGLSYWKNPLTDKVNYYVNDPGNTSSITSNNIFDFAPGNTGNFWVSTFGGGLNYFNSKTKKFFHIAASPNLSEGIATDNADDVWGISNGLVYKYTVTDKSVITFELPDIEKSGGVKGNIFKDTDGNLLVAGAGYFIKLNPQTIKQQTVTTKLFFTDFKIYNTSYSQLLQQKIIRLSYKQNYFSFNFSAPHFINAQGVKYFCKMDGEDKDWMPLGDRDYASYSNLPGGRYTFTVKAVTADNKQQAETFITIEITPPVWKQWWFFVLCAVLISGIVYALYQYRINELVKRQEIRNKIAQDLHDSVGSTLSSISVYSQVAKIYKQKNKEKELQDALEKISDTSGEMIVEMNDIVWAINPRNDDMEKILDRMESFARPLLKTKNISCSFSYGPSVTKLNLPMETRKNFYLIFKEAINNVLKYSGCTNMEVFLKQANGNIELKVKDDGVGFDVEDIKQKAAKSLSGNGLVNMKRRAAELKGKCTIESSAGKGTCITLLLPIP
jgi:ligand-binding sensor domain-containing protein/two-component sensor histidine kinase